MSFGRTKKAAEPLSEPALYGHAVKALGRKMRSVSELRRLMQAKVEPGETGAAKIAAVLLRLKEYGYLDDAAFAETYTRLRQENEKFGARRVRQELGRKGLPQEIVSQAVETGYSDINEETLARQYLDRKRLHKPDNEKETARMMRRMVAAGFTPVTIYKILRQWQVPDEALATLDNFNEEPGEE